MIIRVGHGFDAHRLESVRALIIGGVSIPYERGLAGHSDADVLIHALRRVPEHIRINRVVRDIPEISIEG